MVCRSLHVEVEAKCAIQLLGEEEAATFAKLALSFAAVFPLSGGFANTFCIELAFEPQLLDRVTAGALNRALASLPHLTEVNVQFSMGSMIAWKKIARIIPNQIAKLRLKYCFLEVCLPISATYIELTNISFPCSVNLQSYTPNS